MKLVTRIQKYKNTHIFFHPSSTSAHKLQFITSTYNTNSQIFFSYYPSSHFIISSFSIHIIFLPLTTIPSLFTDLFLCQKKLNSITKYPANFHHQFPNKIMSNILPETAPTIFLLNHLKSLKFIRTSACILELQIMPLRSSVSIFILPIFANFFN